MILKEIIIFISKFLEQLDYDNIQDFYDNNKDLFVPNLKLYEKFIKAFKLKENDESFIRQIKQKYNYQIIQDFKIKSEEEIMGTKKTQKKDTKIETNLKPQISTGKQLEEMKLKSETEKAKIDKSNMTFEIFKNPTTDQLIKMKNDLKNNEFEWIKKALNEGLTETRILEIADFSKQDYKLLNAFFTPKNIIEKMIDNSFFYENVKNFKSQKKVLNILEPTGGTGNIIISILDSLSDEDLKFIKVDFVEINKIFFNIARVKLDKYKDIINFYNQDFLKFRTNTKYDYIFANPPYLMNINKNRIFDVDLFNRCWDMLDFKIVILMSPSSLVLNTNSHNKTFNLNVFLMTFMGNQLK